MTRKKRDFGGSRRGKGVRARGNGGEGGWWGFSTLGGCTGISNVEDDRARRIAGA